MKLLFSFFLLVPIFVFSQTNLLPDVKLVIPSSQINATTNELYNFKLLVLNISAKSDIEIIFNKISQSNFTFDEKTKEVFFQTKLINGYNSFVIKAKNINGEDVEQIGVEYTPHANLKLPPNIVFVSPADSEISVNNASYIFKAVVSNIELVNGLVVTFNKKVISHYFYDGSNLAFQTDLAQGENAFEISAKNADGFISKSVKVFVGQKPVSDNLPVIMFLAVNDTVYESKYQFTFNVKNVTKQQLELKFNNKKINQFKFEDSTVTVNLKLKKGLNTVYVNAKNQYGVVSNEKVVIRKKQSGAASNFK